MTAARRSYALLARVMDHGLSQRQALEAAGLHHRTMSTAPTAPDTEAALEALVAVLDPPRRKDHPTDRSPVHALRAEPWMKGANCVEADINLFVCADSPSSWGRVFPGEDRARLLCSACVVRKECLAYAYRLDDRHAILGGYTPLERKALRLQARSDQLGMEM